MAGMGWVWLITRFWFDLVLTIMVIAAVAVFEWLIDRVKAAHKDDL